MESHEKTPPVPNHSKYVEIYGSNMHYIETGSGDPILFLHGNPTSSYLWRNIIPYLAPHGRCIALDLIGMGKSDKPKIDYRFVDHYQYVEQFIEKVQLKNVTLVIHDWGSALGFAYAMNNEENVKGLAFMEAILTPVDSWNHFPSKVRLMFKLFRKPVIGWLLLGYGNLFLNKIMPMSIIRKLSEEEMNHYRAPFTSTADRIPIWRWPNEIPIEGNPHDVQEIVERYSDWLKETNLPKLFLYAHPGALNRKNEVMWCEKHLKNLTSIDVGAGIHYIQEDHPHKIGKALTSWYQTI